MNYGKSKLIISQLASLLIQVTDKTVRVDEKSSHHNFLRLTDVLLAKSHSENENGNVHLQYYLLKELSRLKGPQQAQQILQNPQVVKFIPTLANASITAGVKINRYL